MQHIFLSYFDFFYSTLPYYKYNSTEKRYILINML